MAPKTAAKPAPKATPKGNPGKVSRSGMNPRLEKAINDQIKAELYSAYLYLSMSSWFDSEGLKGFAHWERVQAMEERDHALKFFDYLLSRGGRAVMQAIEAPPLEWRGYKEVFETQLAHEQKVTSLINAIMDLAIAERDHASVNMLQWFVAEQVEEEENAREILDQMSMIEKEKGVGLLFMLDREMGARVYTPPPASTE